MSVLEGPRRFERPMQRTPFRSSSGGVYTCNTCPTRPLYRVPRLVQSFRDGCHSSVVYSGPLFAFFCEVSVFHLLGKPVTSATITHESIW